MSTFDIVLAAVVAVVVLLTLGGVVASGRRARARHERLGEQIQHADRALASARAADNGWDPAHMEAAARAAVTGEATLHLVQVVDRPGTDADEAVYRAVTPDGNARDIRLTRSGDTWSA